MTDQKEKNVLPIRVSSGLALHQHRQLVLTTCLIPFVAWALLAMHIPLFIVIVASLLLFRAAWREGGITIRSFRRSRIKDIEIMIEVIPPKLRWAIFWVGLIFLVYPIPLIKMGGLPVSLIPHLFGLVIAWSVVSSQMGIIINAATIEGIGSIYRRSLFMRPKRSWHDLHSVGLQMEELQTVALHSGAVQPVAIDKRNLTLHFRSGGSISIPLNKLSAADLHCLMMCVAQYADPLTLNNDVAALQKSVLTLGPESPSLSFTQFWQDNLRADFAETNFVPLQVGHNLKEGELTVVLPLSSGGARAVYLCSDSKGRQCVVKEFSLSMLSDPAARTKHLELFRREAQILAKLDHPQIVKVLDTFVEQGRQYTLLEFIPGITLLQFVQLRGPMDEPSVRDIARQIAEILEYLHTFTEPIVHRDITPDNLVLNEKNKRVTLIDFGAANEVALQANSTVIGKQCYIAPEQLRGAACTQSDLFSLGATMFFLLVGQEPEPISTLYPAQSTRKISAYMNTLVAQMTAMEIRQRPQSANEIVAMLK